MPDETRSLSQRNNGHPHCLRNRASDGRVDEIAFPKTSAASNPLRQQPCPIVYDTEDGSSAKHCSNGIGRVTIVEAGELQTGAHERMASSNGGASGCPRRW